MVKEDIKKKIKEEVERGNVVILHPEATKKFRGQKVKPINYP